MEKIRILNEMAARYMNQPRTFIVRKWLDGSLNITDRRRKRYKGKRINVDAFGALPAQDGLWRLAARLKDAGIIQFSQAGPTTKITRTVSRLNNKLAK